MYLLALPFTFIEIAIFSIALIALLITIRFFMASQKRLENLLPNGKKKKHFGIDRDGFIVPAIQKAKQQNQKAYNDSEETKSEIKELRNMLQLQQLELTRALRQIEDIAAHKEDHYYKDEEDRYDEEPPKRFVANDGKLEELQLELQRKEYELKELRQQNELANKLQGHFEEVQSGYDELQQKVQKMEQQAWAAAELTNKVESLELENEQLEKTVLKKEEKIRELSVENGRLHESLNETEDKLSEANFQRQQLSKKVQFLEEINSDIQQMSDANRKLKNELRRVAELESMLNLITEERDALLKRKRF